MKRYAIAEYLTPEERRRARGKYKPTVNGPRAGGWCPLGKALPLFWWRDFQRVHAPDEITIAEYLAQQERGPLESIQDAAQEFIAAWDSGEIAIDQLDLALGINGEAKP